MGAGAETGPYPETRRGDEPCFQGCSIVLPNVILQTYERRLRVVH